MIAMTLAQVSTAVNGRCTDEVDLSTTVTGKVVHDSRLVSPGDLFVAIKGENFDGHDFVDTALEMGAVAAIVEQAADASPAPAGMGAGARIVVEDTLIAVGLLANAVLALRPELTVIALTGSSGKTSTKDILGQVLASARSTVWPSGSFNNELGLPMTVLTIDEGTADLVLEMGARGIGHIATLCRIATPSIAVVLNVGSAHIGEFGSRDAIAQAKGEIVEALSSAGTAVLNSDDPLVVAMAGRTGATVRWFGSGAQADVQVVDVELDAGANVFMTLRIDEHQRSFRLPLRGAHQALNAAAAAAAATAAGMSAAQVFDALEQVGPQSRWRMEVCQALDGTVIVNDAYNANPESMAVALRALAAMGVGKTTWAVLGEMRELGPESMMAHDEVGRLAVRLGIDNLVGIGEPCRPMVLGAASEGYYGGEAYYAAGTQEAREYLLRSVAPGDVVLLKASRGVALEVLAEQLVADHGGAGTAADPTGPAAEADVDVAVDEGGQQ